MNLTDREAQLLEAHEAGQHEGCPECSESTASLRARLDRIAELTGAFEADDPVAEEIRRLVA
jgi:hypothetical protein